jgi:mRNA interferase HigB
LFALNIFIQKHVPVLGTFINFVNQIPLRVIAKKILRDFWKEHPECEQPLKCWYREAERVHWKTPNQLKQQYPSASILENNRIVFNIKGNKYRLVARINYDFGIVWIRFIGTHAQYDKINAETI